MNSQVLETTKDENGGFLGQKTSAMVEVAASRVAQEVQAMMIMAKRFPRDQATAFQSIMEACKRPSLAEQSQYAYPRGKETVEGPSIRLAEVLMQNWGNIDAGVVEVEQRKGESVMMAYAWDTQTNTRDSKIFTVPHIRHTRNGQYDLTDPRDIYEMTANQAARRKRACILTVIPGDIVESAMIACDKTMAGANDEPLIDRVRKMVSAFDANLVSPAMIETRLGHKIDTTSEPELANLRKIFRSIKDNFASVESFFPAGGATPPSEKTDKLNESLRQQSGVKTGSPGGTQEPPKESQQDRQTMREPKSLLNHQELVDALNEAAMTLGKQPSDVHEALKAADIPKGKEDKVTPARRLEIWKTFVGA